MAKEVKEHRWHISVMLLVEQVLTVPFVLFLSLSMISVAHAVTTKTATVGVTVTLQTVCTAGTSVSGSISFGTLNFGNYSSLTQNITTVGGQNSGALLVQCSAGATYKIVMNSGSNSSTVNPRYMKSSGASTISYYLYSDSGFQTIWDNVIGVSRTATGQQEWVPVYGRVPSQTTPVAGTYTDLVQVTVSW